MISTYTTKRAKKQTKKNTVRKKPKLEGCYCCESLYSYCKGTPLEAYCNKFGRKRGTNYLMGIVRHTKSHRGGK